MENTGYVTLTRQSGLMREMQIVANNIANSATTGYRQEGLVFSEYVQKSDNNSSVSMGYGGAGNTSMMQGTMTQTNGPFDLAIEGNGFFLVETPSGERLTRAWAFTPNAQGDLVTSDGYRVLDGGGAPVFIPANVSGLKIAPDGTISADGQPIGQVGLYQPIDPTRMTREDGVMFNSDEGFENATSAQILQGFLEGSNVDAISQLARMIEVQRAYELGQSFLESEDQRIRDSVKSLLK